MENPVIESAYPIGFRKEEASELGKHLKNRHSVVLLGMKRVGISNFLRFFLYNKDVVRTYIHKTEQHLFIPVDLNDLVEREIFPFWILTLKRIVDVVEKSPHIDRETKKYIESLFLDSIQSKDLFLLIESVRKSLVRLIEKNMLPTLFFLRFDRMKDAVTHEFFDNLQGLRDATHEKVSYVFTSFRGLDILSPTVFTKSSLSTFSHTMHIHPARKEDTEVIYETYRSRYNLRLSPAIEKALFGLVDGYIQYLQLSLISLHERKKMVKDKKELEQHLLKDERLALQSEELWESLTIDEQAVLLKIIKRGKLTEHEKEKAKYIWDTGFVENNGKLFSPLFTYYISQKQEKRKAENAPTELSKKEHMLFSFLQGRINEICEREAIIKAVWPEVEAFGVSDWAIDRLVARVRGKLKAQIAAYEIQTVKTRGYKLVKA